MFWGILLVIAILLHIKPYHAFLVVFSTIFLIILYEIYTKTRLLHAETELPRAIENARRDRRFENVWVWMNGSPRTASLEGWVIMGLLLLWSIIWAKLFWDIWDLFLDSVT